MAQTPSANGQMLSVQDFVKYPNATAGTYPPFNIAVITAINPGAGTVNTTYLKKDGTTGTDTAILATTCVQIQQAGGPGNAESNPN